MYHDTIHIIFNYYDGGKDINFDYNFLISQISQPTNIFTSIKYSELLQKFEELGFNLKYIKFNDIDDFSTMVHCTYNYQPNLNVFFSAYKKFIKLKPFNITFEYGNIIDGKFYPNNMNTFSGVHFISAENTYGRAKSLAELNADIEVVIQGKKHYKVRESYQIIDKKGVVIVHDFTNIELNFEQHFFENYKVKVALRKFKLSQLKKKFK